VLTYLLTYLLRYWAGPIIEWAGAGFEKIRWSRSGAGGRVSGSAGAVKKAGVTERYERWAEFSTAPAPLPLRSHALQNRSEIRNRSIQIQNLSWSSESFRSFKIFVGQFQNRSKIQNAYQISDSLVSNVSESIQSFRITPSFRIGLLGLLNSESVLIRESFTNHNHKFQNMLRPSHAVSESFQDFSPEFRNQNRSQITSFRMHIKFQNHSNVSEYRWPLCASWVRHLLKNFKEMQTPV